MQPTLEECTSWEKLSRRRCGVSGLFKAKGLCHFTIQMRFLPAWVADHTPASKLLICGPLSLSAARSCVSLLNDKNPTTAESRVAQPGSSAGAQSCTQHRCARTQRRHCSYASYMVTSLAGRHACRSSLFYPVGVLIKKGIIVAPLTAAIYGRKSDVLSAREPCSSVMQHRQMERRCLGLRVVKPNTALLSPPVSGLLPVGAGRAEPALLGAAEVEARLVGVAHAGARHIRQVDGAAGPGRDVVHLPAQAQVHLQRPRLGFSRLRV